MHTVIKTLIFGIKTRTSATVAALTATLVLAAVCWIVVVFQMNGMDMGVATPDGSFTSFIVMWVLMMATMMLPGMVPTVFGHVHVSDRLGSVLLFVGSYLTVWALIGIPVYALYRPYGTLATGVLTIAAGLYELTPFKQYCRRWCCESVHSGLDCGLYCVGSCIGLMLMHVALGFMSVTWMVMITVFVFVQKNLPAKTTIDVPLALMIIGLGMLIRIAPSTIPGLMPLM